MTLFCKHCRGEVKEKHEGGHFTAVHVSAQGCNFDKLGESDVTTQTPTWHAANVRNVLESRVESDLPAQVFAVLKAHEGKPVAPAPFGGRVENSLGVFPRREFSL